MSGTGTALLFGMKHRLVPCWLVRILSRAGGQLTDIPTALPLPQPRFQPAMCVSMSRLVTQCPAVIGRAL